MHLAGTATAASRLACLSWLLMSGLSSIRISVWPLRMICLRSNRGSSMALLFGRYGQPLVQELLTPAATCVATVISCPAIARCAIFKPGK